MVDEQNLFKKPIPNPSQREGEIDRIILSLKHNILLIKYNFNSNSRFEFLPFGEIKRGLS